MKFSVLQENLLRGLNTVSRAVPTKPDLEILRNILITAENGRIMIAANSLKTAIVTYIGGSVEEGGSLTVPAKLIKDYISTLSPGTIEVETVGDTLHLKSKKAKTKLNGINAKEFPALPDFEGTYNYLELDPKVFSAMATLVSFAAGNDDTRPVFTGVYVQYSEGKLILAATDGFRLSEKIINIVGEVEDFKAIISAKTFSEVSRIFSGTKENIKMTLAKEKNMMLFISEDTYVSTTLMGGQYPDYKRIIPQESSLTATFSSEEFAEAVRTTQVFAKSDDQALKVRFDTEGYIRVASISGEIGDNESEIEAEIEGETIEVAFNSRYLTDYLANVKSERIVLKANGNTAPCLIVTDNNEDYLHIIMPFQL